jgi:competence protein ComEC
VKDEPGVVLAAAVGPVALWALASVVSARVVLDLAEGGVAPSSFVVPAAITAVCALTALARRRGRAFTAVALVASAVVLTTALRLVTVPIGILPALVDAGGTRTVTMKVVAEPRPIANGWQLLVRVLDVDGTATRERAAAIVADDPPALGTTWRVRASARPLPDGGYGRWLRAQHAQAVLDIDGRALLDAGGPLARSSEHVRVRIRDAATRRAPPDAAGLLVGLVTGDVRLLHDADREAMRRTGLGHLTAVSGAHVALVVGGALAVASAAGLSAARRRWLVGATIVWFAYLTRLQPSVLRAGTMALILLLVAARGRATDARHALAVAVLFLMLADPMLAGSLGLLLSATATAGVLVITPHVRARLTRLPERIATIASVTIAAQLAVAPVLLAAFGEVRLAALPANVLGVPFAMVAAALGFVASLVAVVAPGPAAWLLWLAAWPAGVVLRVARLLSEMPGVLTSATTVAALLVGAAWALRRSRVLAVGAVVLAIVAVGTPVAGALAPRALTVTAIDVGQGDAFLVESPRARILVDAGGDDAAARWLRANGRRRLDLLIVTHPHLDHLGGAAEVLRRLHVDTVWFRPVPHDLDAIDEMLLEADRQATSVRVPIAGGGHVIGDVHVEVLHPPPGRPYRWAASELNEMSTVVRITHADGRRALFTGDVESAAQRRLLAEQAHRLRAELITVPHHGAATSEPTFLVATGASVALIGVGEGNRHGHPHPEVLEVLADLGVAVHRTDRDGTVRVTVPERRIAGAVPRPVAYAVASSGRE